MATSSTTLAGPITANAAVVTLTSFSNPGSVGISPKVWITVDGESMLVTNSLLSPTLQVVRGYNATVASAHATGAPVSYGVAGDFVVTNLVPNSFSYSVNGPIAIPTTPSSIPAQITITKAGVCALTLAAPAADQNGLTLQITSNTAFAHTITATGLFQTGAATVNLATFAAFAGASVTLEAVGGNWNVIFCKGVTFT